MEKYRALLIMVAIVLFCFAAFFFYAAYLTRNH